MRQCLASLTMLLAMAVCQGSLAQTSIAADSEAGRALAQPCAACHGPTGESPFSLFPHLAGQQASYLVKQLEEIRDGQREIPQMLGQLDDFSDQDIRDVATFYAEQPAPLGQAEADEALIKRGRELFRGGDREQGIPACSACHTPTGRGIDSAGFPTLAGQHADYTLATLEAFAEGDRDNDPNAIMREIADKLSERDRQALANYLQGLR